MTDAGESPATLDDGAGASAGARGPAEYVREAVRIARFDENAIERVAGDRRALKYGALVVAVAGVLVYLAESLLRPAPAADEPPGALGHVVAIPLVILVQLGASAVQVALIHGLAKLFLGATGGFVRLLRVLWLASVVSWLAIIPVIGPIAAGLWYLLITLVTFEIVDGLERLQALVLVVAIGAAMMFLRTMM